jgi:hypothetical protein
MRISSLFPAVITAITAAGFALTETRPVAAPIDTQISGQISLQAAPLLSGTMLAAFDPLALAPRAFDDNVR